MKPKIGIIVFFLCGVGLILIITVLLVTPILLRDRSIHIKTNLLSEETCNKVALSSGMLYFKTEKDVYAEMTDEERNAYKPKHSDYNPEYTKVFAVKEEDILHVLNIDPLQWCIPERFVFSYELYAKHIKTVWDDSQESEYSDDILYSRQYRCSNEDGGFFVSIEVALPGKRWIRQTELSSQSAQHVKAVYGKLDSKIGDMPVSVLSCEFSVWDRLFDAYFVAGNSAYFIRSNGMTQQEFVKLLISVYEAPRPVTEDPLSALYDGAIGK